MSRSLQRCLILGPTGLLVALALCGGPPAPADEAPAKPPHKGYSETITDKAGLNKATFEMVPIPGGTYLMGSPKDEKGRQPDEGPQHPVTVKPFWMGKYEVTWDEFDLFWRANPGQKEDKEPEKPRDADAVTRPTPPYADETFDHGRAGHPVLCITHHAALQYCRWLSIKTGKLYRLPTEAEWEWAARAGTKTAYYFGDDPAKLGDHAWYEANSEGKSKVVGKKKPNPWGLYDIYGNVAEWCIDYYKKDYYSTFPLEKATLQPVLIPTGARFSHVARGGSWMDEPPLCRSAARRGSEKDWIQQDPQRPQSIWWLTNADFVGFRVVRPVEEQENLKDFRSRITRRSPDKD